MPARSVHGSAAIDEATYYRVYEGFQAIEPIMAKWRARKLQAFWRQWTLHVRDENSEKMEGDRSQPAVQPPTR